MADLWSFQKRVTSLILLFITTATLIRVITMQIKVSMHCLILLRQVIWSGFRYLIRVSTGEDRCIEWNSCIRQDLRTPLLCIFQHQRVGSFTLYGTCIVLWLLQEYSSCRPLSNLVSYISLILGQSSGCTYTILLFVVWYCWDLQSLKLFFVVRK